MLRTNGWDPILYPWSPLVVSSARQHHINRICALIRILNPQYSDQAGLFLYISDTLWIKTGLEVVDGQARVSCVVTDSYADW